MGGVRIGRVQIVKDPKVESAIQEVTTEMGNNLQTGTASPGATTPGKVYFKHGAADSNGWATVTTVYINTQR